MGITNYNFMTNFYFNDFTVWLSFNVCPKILFNKTLKEMYNILYNNQKLRLELVNFAERIIKICYYYQNGQQMSPVILKWKPEGNQKIIRPWDAKNLHNLIFTVYSDPYKSGNSLVMAVNLAVQMQYKALYQQYANANLLSYKGPSLLKYTPNFLPLGNGNGSYNTS
jgi:hypothetical protein